jgi:hypothetical protein
VQSQGLRAIPVLGARVPIIKIRDQSDTRLAVDLSVENELPGTHFTCFTGTMVQIRRSYLPVLKSRLLLEYSLIDKRFALSLLALLVQKYKY